MKQLMEIAQLCYKSKEVPRVGHGTYMRVISYTVSLHLGTKRSRLFSTLSSHRIVIPVGN